MLQVSPRISAKIRTMEGNGPKDREDVLKYAIQNIIKTIKPPPPLPLLHCRATLWYILCY